MKNFQKRSTWPQTLNEYDSKKTNVSLRIEGKQIKCYPLLVSVFGLTYLILFTGINTCETI